MARLQTSFSTGIGEQARRIVIPGGGAFGSTAVLKFAQFFARPENALPEGWSVEIVVADKNPVDDAAHDTTQNFSMTAVHGSVAFDPSVAGAMTTNIPARVMALKPEDADSVRNLQELVAREFGVHVAPTDSVPRAAVGMQVQVALADALKAAPDSIVIGRITGEVNHFNTAGVTLLPINTTNPTEPDFSAPRLNLDASAILLAPGLDRARKNQRPNTPGYITNPLTAEGLGMIDRVDPKRNVWIDGVGLEAVDVIQRLLKSGHKGKIILESRNFQMHGDTTTEKIELPDPRFIGVFAAEMDKVRALHDGLLNEWVDRLEKEIQAFEAASPEQFRRLFGDSQTLSSWERKDMERDVRNKRHAYAQNLDNAPEAIRNFFRPIEQFNATSNEEAQRRNDIVFQYILQDAVRERIQERLDVARAAKAASDGCRKVQRLGGSERSYDALFENIEDLSRALGRDHDYSMRSKISQAAAAEGLREFEELTGMRYNGRGFSAAKVRTDILGRAVRDAKRPARIAPQQVLENWDQYMPQVAEMMGIYNFRNLYESRFSVISALRIGADPKVMKGIREAMRKGQVILRSPDNRRAQRMEFRGDKGDVRIDCTGYIMDRSRGSLAAQAALEAGAKAHWLGGFEVDTDCRIQFHASRGGHSPKMTIPVFGVGAILQGAQVMGETGLSPRSGPVATNWPTAMGQLDRAVESCGRMMLAEIRQQVAALEVKP